MTIQIIEAFKTHLNTSVSKSEYDQIKKLGFKDLKVLIFDRPLSKLQSYTVYITVAHPNEDDPRQNSMHLIYAYNAKINQLTLLQRSTFNYMIEYFTDFDGDGFFEILTSESPIESPEQRFLIYLKNGVVYTNKQLIQ